MAVTHTGGRDAIHGGLECSLRVRVRLLAAPDMGSPRRETQAVQQVARGWQTYFNPDPACLERDLLHNHLHQLPIDLLPASGPFIQGIFNPLVLDIVQLAPMRTVVNLMIPRSPRRIHLKVIAPCIQRG
jgi:hypothetical protein